MNQCRECPICDLKPESSDRIGGLAVNHHNRHLFERQEYDLTYCACGELIYLSPLPTARDISSMYVVSEQFGQADGGESLYRGERSAAVIEYTTSRLLEIMRSREIPISTHLKVLEVGAGLAWMCRAAKIVRWDNYTVAQDLSSEAADECRWVNQYIVEDLMESDTISEQGPFDIISLTHVIEHLTHPVTMLEMLCGLLSDRGTIFVTAPFRPHDWHREAEINIWEQWSYNHIPAHIQYFSEESLTKAATAAGLEVALWDHHQDGGQAFEAWLRKG